MQSDPVALAAAVAAAGPEPEVVIEATYGWYWAVDLLQSMGARVHLANPKALRRATRMWGSPRVLPDLTPRAYKARARWNSATANS